jgi:hypothetical protein
MHAWMVEIVSVFLSTAHTSPQDRCLKSFGSPRLSNEATVEIRGRHRRMAQLKEAVFDAARIKGNFVLALKLGAILSEAFDKLGAARSGEPRSTADAGRVDHELRSPSF